MPILMCGCHHAREWISVEVPFLLAQFLVDNYSKDKKVQRIVDSIELWVVPMVNPDGHEQSVLKNRLWRKNSPTDKTRKSVDLNRNYNTSTWNMKVGMFSDDPNDFLEYRGPSPGYAKEVIAMQNLIVQKKFKGVVSYHSCGRFVLFPWAGKTLPPPDSKEDEMATSLKTLIDSKGTAKNIVYTKAQSSTLYQLQLGLNPADALIPGDMLDFVIENLPDCIAITIELEPDIDDVARIRTARRRDSTNLRFTSRRNAGISELNNHNPESACSPAMKLQKPGIPSPFYVAQPESWRAFQNY